MSRAAKVFAFLSLAFAAACAFHFCRVLYADALSGIEIFILALLAAGMGRLILSLIGLADISESQKTLIGATLGLGVLSLSFFGLAAGHALKGWTAALVLAGFWILGWTEMRQTIASLSSNKNLLEDRPAAAAAIAALLGLVFWIALIPPHQYDELVYHLALPQTYAAKGALTLVRGLVYSYFPQNAEMLFTLSLLLKSDALAHLFMWLCLALSSWWIFEMGKLETPLSCAIIACLLLLSHTAAMILSSAAYVEPLAMLWTTAAVLCFLRWREVSEADPKARGWLLLSASFVGLALGTKYYAGAAAGILGCALAWRAITGANGQRSARTSDLAAFTLVAAAFAAPWLIRNALNCGDPVFPFLAGIFPLKHPARMGAAAAGYFQTLAPYALHRGGGQSFGGGMDVLGTLGWPVIFWFLPAGIWHGRKNRYWRSLAWFLSAYGAIWFCTGMVLRFLTAVLPLLCLLSAVGITETWKRLPSRGRAALAGAVSVLIAVNVFLFLFIELGVFGGSKILLGLQGRNAFLSRRLDYYPCALFASGHFGGNDKILIVGEQRGYYVRPDHLAATIYGANSYILWANRAKSPEDLANIMKDHGFSHILAVPRESRRLGKSLGELSPVGQNNFSGLSKFLAPVFRAPGCSLLAISPGESS
ncbi:MAG: ArnT family glycosyltransferase [Elusimicrobiota bacterium]